MILNYLEDRNNLCENTKIEDTEQLLRMKESENLQNQKKTITNLKINDMDDVTDNLNKDFNNKLDDE